MRRSGTWLVVVVAVASIAVAHGQTKVVGAWTGKIEMRASKAPKLTDPNQKRMMDGLLAQIKALRMRLNLNANKTFTLKVTGAPATPKGSAKSAREQVGEGTWSQKGSVITLKLTKANGAAPKGQNPPRYLNVVGKTLEMNNPAMQGAKVVFSR